MADPENDRLDNLVKAVREAVELNDKAEAAKTARAAAFDRVQRMVGGDGDVLSAIDNGRREIGRIMTENGPAAGS